MTSNFDPHNGSAPVRYREPSAHRTDPYPPSSPPAEDRQRQSPSPSLTEEQKGDFEKAAKKAATKAVHTLIREELDSLATKLVATNERVFNQFDRFSAEASLRLSLAPALAALICVIAWRVSGWCLLALAVPAILEIQGYHRARRANDILARSVISNVIHSTSIENAGQDKASQDFARDLARLFDGKARNGQVPAPPGQTARLRY
jgi:hypothetical protein